MENKNTEAISVMKESFISVRDARQQSQVGQALVASTCSGKSGLGEGRRGSAEIAPAPDAQNPGTVVPGFRLSKNPRRAREGRNPLELSIVPSGVYGGHGTIFAPENLIFQSKNRFLAVFAPGNLLDFSKNW